MRLLLLVTLVVAACTTTEPPTHVEPSPTINTMPSPTAAAAARVPVEAVVLTGGGPAAADRVAAHQTTLTAVFGNEVFVGWDGVRWERSQVPFSAGETPTAIGVDPLSRARFVGTSAGRIFRLDSWYGTKWREVYAAPAGTFQPAVERFSFRDHFAYASLKGVVASEDDLPWKDLTPGLGGLPDRIESRGRFGTGPVVPLEDRLLVHIGGNLPEATGLWSRGADGRWARASFPGPHPRGMTAIANAVVAVGQPALDLAGRPLAGSWMSQDRGATWRPLVDPEPGGLLDVAPTPLGFIGLGSAGLYWLAPNDRWLPIAGVQGGSAIAANGREVLVATAQGVFGFRVQPAPTSPTERCGYELRGPGGGTDPAARDCLLRAYAAGRTAQLLVTRHTIEGDPIKDTVRILGDRSIEVLTEDDDPYGRPGFFVSVCTDLRRIPGTASGFDVAGCTGGRSGFHFP